MIDRAGKTEAHALRLPAAIVAGLLVSACGGGGGGSVAGIDGTGINPPGGGTTAHSFGTVTGFGSIIVNGVRFDTSGASFEIDDAPGSESDLEVGDVVLVTGSLSSTSPGNGVATSVFFDDVVEGPIEAGSIDPIGNTFVVLGQTVNVSSATSFDDSIQPPTIAGLSDGDIVEVSGFFASDGSIEATRIEPKPAALEFEVRGLVENLDTAAFTFMINALEVDYSQARLDDFPGGMINDGDLVEVEGMNVIAGVLEATKVEFEGGELAADEDDHVEVEGLITRFVSATDFDVSGFPVTTTNQTIFENGVAADLGLDIKVEVEGVLDANGVLVADKVDIRRASVVRLLAAVDSVGATSFVALGITVNVDALTRLEDKSSVDDRSFTIAELAAGDIVEVRGTEFPAGGGALLAALVEREDPIDPDDVELQGFVTSVGANQFTILGVLVSTDATTEFEAEDETPISAATFYSQVVAASGGNAGSLVKAQGTETAPTMLQAVEVEFESE